MGKNAFILITITLLSFTVPVRGVERNQNFDFGWLFFKGEAQGAQKTDFDDASWRKLDVPHDWSIEDLPTISDQMPKSQLNPVKGTWKFMKGDNMTYCNSAYDDALWQQVELPNSWETHSNYYEDNVFGWYRRDVLLPDSLKNQDLTLLLGQIDDADEVFFNGILVGKTGGFPPNFDSKWQEERAYTVKKELVNANGPNLIAVRVFDSSGGGGMFANAVGIFQSGPFNSQATNGKSTGFTVGGTGWYRKHFTLNQSQVGKRFSITFDGVYMNADVWINGHHLGNHPYGYTAFSFDLTEFVRTDGTDNVVAVEVKNLGSNSRWYSGSGIYRHVWLTATNPVSISNGSTFINTVKADEATALVNVISGIENKTGQVQKSTIITSIIDAKNTVVSTKNDIQELQPGTSTNSSTTLTVTKPILWSTANPYLYKVRISVVLNKAETDRTETVIGIRTIEFNANKGFLLNGQKTLLRGGCMHHDNGPLGSKAFDRAEERRVQLMKANGFNAIRTSHNPPSSAFLDACDREGILVIDEAFDDWSVGKNSDDYNKYFNEWWRKDLESMINRDRNHPSIIMWSIGNETNYKNRPDMVQNSEALANFVHSLDATRPVTAAVNHWAHLKENWDSTTAHFAKPLDVVGYNYLPNKYESDHAKYPQRLIYGSESYPADPFSYVMPMLDLPYVIGDFVWTGFDYIGESAIGFDYKGGYPWALAYCGDIDLCGFKRPQSYYREILWNTGKKVAVFVKSPVPTFNKPTSSGWSFEDVHSSWNWEGYEGKDLDVVTYSNCEKVKLMLNGQVLGIKNTGRSTKFKANWKVPYASGTLQAIGMNGDQVVEVSVLQTTGKVEKIKLVSDRPVIKANGQDLCYITVELTDANGFCVPFVEQEIQIDVTGAGKLIAIGNAKPNSVESFQGNKHTTFEGRCIAIIQSAEKAGEIVVKASCGKILSSVSIKTGN
jgi:beta-galactosidase